MNHQYRSNPAARAAACLALLALSLSAARAAAQTTRPASPAWIGTAQAFAKSLAAGNESAQASFIAERAAIRAFDRADADDNVQSLAAVARGTVLGVHAYAQAPASLASDIAADIKAFEAAPDAVKTRFAPANENDLQRANAIAAKWVAELLELPQSGKPAPVAAIVIWPSTPAANASGPRSAAPQPPEPILVLIKADETTATRPKIRHITYGTPQSALN